MTRRRMAAMVKGWMLVRGVEVRKVRIGNWKYEAGRTKPTNVAGAIEYLVELSIHLPNLRHNESSTVRALWEPSENRLFQFSIIR